MRRLLFLIPAFAVLTACIPELQTEEDTTETVTNEEGTELDAAIQRLNGLWDGQLDQAGALRVLIYNGTVYGFDETTGLYGTSTLNESGASVDMTLKRYTFSNTEADAGQYSSSGTATTHYFSGLLFPTQVDDDTLVGDYETSSTFGSFTLSNDGTWENGSDLAQLTGLWTATGYELYITQVDNHLAFREISSSVTGCTSSGFIDLINQSEVIYEVTVTERKNCNDFNVEEATGYATITAEGDLEFFLRKNTALLFSHFSRGSSTDSSDDSADSSTDDTTDDSTDDSADDTTDDSTDETADDTTDDTTDETTDDTADDTTDETTDDTDG